MSGRLLLDTGERRRRLITRHHLGATARDVDEAIGGVLALHSSDPATPYLAARARVAGLTTEDVEDALYGRRSAWRIHSIRRTIWVVPLERGPTWLGAATVDIAVKERRRLVGWITDGGTTEHPEAWLDGLTHDVLGALKGQDPMSTKEIGESVAEITTKITLGSGRWRQEQAVGSRLLVLMAMDGMITRGRPLGSWRASQYRWARTEEWFDRPAEALTAGDPKGARADLLRAYLAAFGPVTLDDIRWWSGWTKTRSVAALTAVDAVVVDLDNGAEGWVLPDDLGSTPAADDGVVSLLPSLDPTPMGWKHRHWYLGELTEFGGPLFDRNGNVGPTIWVDGHVVGGWGQRPDGEVVVRVLLDIDAESVDAICAEAAAMQAWLGEHVVIPRFRAPLEKQLAGR